MDKRVHALHVLQLVPELFQHPVRGRLDEGERADPIRVFGHELERGLATA